jgi:hypothetical protein
MPAKTGESDPQWTSEDVVARITRRLPPVEHPTFNQCWSGILEPPPEVRNASCDR